jgi:hypothetical protein
VYTAGLMDDTSYVAASQTMSVPMSKYSWTSMYRIPMILTGVSPELVPAHLCLPYCAVIMGQTKKTTDQTAGRIRWTSR